MSETKATFYQWALVELFGHQRIAGRVTEAEISGGKFIRVDVPQIGNLQPVTRFYGAAAIYGITPVTEDTALRLAAQIEAAPLAVWDAQRLFKDKQLPSSVRDDDDEEEDERNFD
jgi:hypothetical protein